MNNFEFDFEGWAILELMGRRRVAGHITPVTIGSTVLIQINQYTIGKDEPLMTQFYNPGSLYCLTPSTEETCRAYVSSCQVAPPIHKWELQLEAHSNTDDEEF